MGDIWPSRTRDGTANTGISFCSVTREEGPDLEPGMNLPPAPYNAPSKKDVRVGLGFFWVVFFFETTPKQPSMNLLISRTYLMVSVENDVTSGKIQIEVSINVHHSPSLAEVTGSGHKLWHKWSSSYFEKNETTLIVWSLGKQLLIQLHLLIALLFWAFPDVFLGLAWTFILIKTNRCYISPWFTTSKRSESTECAHTTICARGCRVQVKSTKNAASACSVPLPTKRNHTAAAGTAGMGKLLLHSMGGDVLRLEKKNGFWAEIFNCGFWCGLRTKSLFAAFVRGFLLVSVL